MSDNILVKKVEETKIFDATKKSILQATKAGVIPFEMSNDLLASIILKQAGSVEKAAQEAVQNGVDAEAKNIVLQIAETTLDYEDDGYGMTKEVIMSAFKIFGESPKSGDETKIGQFGMGRGQIFAMGVNTWETQNFRLKVDITKGLGFTFEELPAPVKGCKIHVDLYDEKKVKYPSMTARNLCEKFIFPGIKVTVNGMSTVDLSKEKVIEKTGFRLFVVPKIEGVQVYVKGMYVCNINDFAATGYLLCDDLTLNFARNDFIHDKKYADFEAFQKYADAQYIIHLDKRTNFPNWSTVIRSFEAGYLVKDNLMKLKFILSYEGGAYYNPQSLLEQTVWNLRGVESDKKYQVANEWKNEMGGLIIDAGEVLVTFLSKNFGIKIRDINSDGAQKLKEILAKLNEKSENVDEVKASKRVKVYLDYIRWMGEKIANKIRQDERKIAFVKSAGYSMATNGTSSITVNMGIISVDKPKYLNLGKIAVDLIHEYSHNSDDSNGDHDLNFYERFHLYMGKCAELIGEFLTANMATQKITY